MYKVPKVKTEIVGSKYKNGVLNIEITVSVDGKPMPGLKKNGLQKTLEDFVDLDFAIKSKHLQLLNRNILRKNELPQLF